MKRTTIAMAAAAMATLVSVAGVAASKSDTSMKQEVKDAWIDGKIETLYTVNRFINPFDIDTKVERGAVHLTGTVDSSMEKDLAGEIAKGVDGVASVDNDLRIVAPESRDAAANARKAKFDKDRDHFRTWLDDVSTTAQVKSKLLTNSNTHGLAINVVTKDDVVTLNGKVKSSEERQLAEMLAKNTDGVRSVTNDLEVKK